MVASKGEKLGKVARAARPQKSGSALRAAQATAKPHPALSRVCSCLCSADWLQRHPAAARSHCRAADPHRSAFQPARGVDVIVATRDQAMSGSAQHHQLAADVNSSG